MSEPLYTEFAISNIAAGIAGQSRGGEVVERYVYGALFEMSRQYEAKLASLVSWQPLPDDEYQQGYIEVSDGGTTIGIWSHEEQGFNKCDLPDHMRLCHKVSETKP